MTRIRNEREANLAQWADTVAVPRDRNRRRLERIEPEPGMPPGLGFLAAAVAVAIVLLIVGAVAGA
jgi:hypothetical protein